MRLSVRSVKSTIADFGFQLGLESVYGHLRLAVERLHFVVEFTRLK